MSAMVEAGIPVIEPLEDGEYGESLEVVDGDTVLDWANCGGEFANCYRDLSRKFPHFW